MRKLLILLLLPIVAFTTMGSALYGTAAPQAAAVSVSAAAPAAAPAGIVAGDIVRAIPDDQCSYAGCFNTDPDARDKKYAESTYLPTNRWTEMNYHSRLNAWNPIESSNAAMSRATAGIMMNSGNQAWKLASDWSRQAMGFSPLDSQLGFQIDKVSGVIGKAITGQPVLFALIIVFLIVVVMWRAMRRPGTRPFGKLFQAAVVFGLITMMGTQAAAGTAGAPTDSYKPRAGSPVWIAGAVTGTVDGMASTAVAAVMDGMVPILTSSTDSAKATKSWSCAALISGTFRAADEAVPTAGAKAVALAMNSMWISTAYNTYAVVQFGDSNPYAKEVACRQLERTTSASPYSRARLMSQGVHGDMYSIPWNDISRNTPFAALDVPMLQDTTDNDANDAAMVAWAACAPANANATSFTVRNGFSGKDGQTWITPEACQAAFGAKNADEMKSVAGGAFNIDGMDAARAKTSNDAVLNFFSSLHGRDAGAALGSVSSSMVFVIGAVIAAGIFGLMALAVAASKIFMLILVAGMFILLTVSLFKNDSVGDTMRSPLQRFLGVTIFAFGSTLLLAILATVALIISSLATIWGSAGSIGAMMWVSMSPIIAVVAVHFLFTKVFKMPSPVTPKGALAWGTAGGAIGGAVGAGLMNRLQNKAMSAAGNKALGSNRFTSWMVPPQFQRGAGQGPQRKGAGNAGTRSDRKSETAEAGNDILSSQLTASDAAAGVDAPRMGAGDAGAPLSAAASSSAPTATGGAGTLASGGAGGGLLGGLLAPGRQSVTFSPEQAEASAERAHEATKYLSAESKRQLQRDAKRQWREENPSALDRGIANLRGKLEARHTAGAEALQAAVASGEVDSESMLTPEARGKVGFINRPTMDDFMVAPGDTAGALGAATPMAEWKDLSPEGKVQATKLAAAQRREAKVTARTEKQTATRQKNEARAAAKAELPPLAERTKATVVGAVKKVGDTHVNARRATVAAAGDAKAKTAAGAQLAWAEAKTKVLEFRADPATTALGAAEATKATAQKAAHATVDAARLATHRTAEGTARAREVAAAAIAKTRTEKGRTVTKGAAVAAGVTLAALGNPVVGTAVVAVAAKRGVTQAREQAASRKMAKQAQLNDIITARVASRKMNKPSTSMTSAAPPVLRASDI
ncbi:hypothetical protein [Microbacterium sp. 77mftsu3.1]|uniref:hypothetical protein n=1 Tax=Microbacterium sp. 77mftsu3.1 TaxID=1761802 RepID=UPI0003603A71|nr:hypothetical protein [Microbacterium sp. 77mftsu3.1]SDH34413.1 hypothetical protein SAMN04488590_3084 [Microbacterium sp. 77mftsu3.1]